MPDSATAMADVMPTVTPFDAALGAEVSNINLSKPLSDAQFAVVEEAFLKHHVLVFRCQPLTDEEHLAFARRFGELEGHVNKSTHHKKHNKFRCSRTLRAMAKPLASTRNLAPMFGTQTNPMWRSHHSRPCCAPPPLPARAVIRCSPTPTLPMTTWMTRPSKRSTA